LLTGEANQEALFNYILPSQLGQAPEAASIPPQGMYPHNPLFSSILELHPKLHAFLIKVIFNPTFKPENLLKLSSCSFYIPGSSKQCCEEITLGEFSIPTSNKEVSLDEYTSIPHLLQLLSLYFYIMIAFTPEDIRAELS
jgi:hypothetical protein